MITAAGRKFIKKYLAGQSGSIVGAISVGIGRTSATINDQRLEFEFYRAPVALTGYDFATDELVFKTTLPENISGVIGEVALWTSEFNSSPGSQNGIIITTFDSTDEIWSPSTFDTAGMRLGTDLLKLTPAAASTSSSILSGLNLDLSQYSSQDTFVLAYNPENSNTANVKLRMKTDASNYYEFTISSPTAGYKIANILKGSAAVTGAPSWDNITQIEVMTTATSGGSASVKFDGIRIEDTDTTTAEYGMVARVVPASQITKTDGLIQDIEFAIPVLI